MFPPSVKGRAEALVAEWCVVPERIEVTRTSVLAFGRRDDLLVVLKIAVTEGDEWLSGDVIRAFRGHGMVMAYESKPGAALLERIEPGGNLSVLALQGDDERASEILTDVLATMRPVELPHHYSTVADWMKGFDRYTASGRRDIPADLVDVAHREYEYLCTSQTGTRLLHGDFHHFNVLHDRRRGWLAIDPKGVIGEPEYELGAVFRNPWHHPDVFADHNVIARRLAVFAKKLGFDRRRMLRWAFAQAVLSAIWTIEDGCSIDQANQQICLARVLDAMRDKH